MPVRYDNHVILGAGGAISRALLPELVKTGEQITVVSRSGASMAGAESRAADALDYDSLSAVVPEGSVVYLLIGLDYNAKVWQELWPPLMENVIRVCADRGALLVFLDNVYMYGPVGGPMTEDTPHRPMSEKGRVRAAIAETLMSSVEKGSLRALIARSADFYGPGAEKSGIPNSLVVDGLIKKGKAQWFADVDRKHSLTYTSDCGRALPYLVADEDAYNQVWHLPTASPPLTMREFTSIAARVLDIEPKLGTYSRAMLKFVGLFNPTVRELPEMLYQYDRDYLFDSSKFEKRYDFHPTPYDQAIRETVMYQRGLPARN
jgi:nucleoside-diphosphate-sugar epimerase